MFTFLTGRCYKTCTHNDKLFLVTISITAFLTMTVLHISIFIINRRDRSIQNSIQANIVTNPSSDASRPNSNDTIKNNLTLISVFLLTVKIIIIMIIIHKFGEKNPFSVRMVITFLGGFAIPLIVGLSKPKVRAFIVKTVRKTRLFNTFSSVFSNAIHPISQ